RLRAHDGGRVGGREAVVDANVQLLLDLGAVLLVLFGRQVGRRLAVAAPRPQLGRDGVLVAHLGRAGGGVEAARPVELLVPVPVLVSLRVVHGSTSAMCPYSRARNAEAVCVRPGPPQVVGSASAARSISTAQPATRVTLASTSRSSVSTSRWCELEARDSGSCSSRRPRCATRMRATSASKSRRPSSTRCAMAASPVASAVK